MLQMVVNVIQIQCARKVTMVERIDEEKKNAEQRTFSSLMTEHGLNAVPGLIWRRSESAHAQKIKKCHGYHNRHSKSCKIKIPCCILKMIMFYVTKLNGKWWSINSQSTNCLKGVQQICWNNISYNFHRQTVSLSFFTYEYFSFKVIPSYEFTVTLTTAWSQLKKN